MNSKSFQWIEQDADFESLCGQLAGESEIALDTESDGFHHYFHKLCLLQISTREKNFLVDTLAVRDLTLLGPIFENRSIRKVLHAAEQDLMYLRRDHGLQVAGLFDTLLAAQLVGHVRLGLAALLEEYFEVKLSKASQRDDWSVRPLNGKQIQYAIADTDLLLPLTDRLHQELAEKDRLPWAEEEFRIQEERDAIPDPVNPDDLTRVKGWKALPPRGRAILRELLRARDEVARMQDRPPFRVVGNPVLLELAAGKTTTPEALHKLSGFPRHRGERLASRLLTAIRRGLDMDPADFPPSPEQRGRRTLVPRSASFRSRMDRLKEWREGKAAALQLEPSVVVPQRDLELLAAEPPATPALLEAHPIRTWRCREFGGDWLRLLAAPD